MDLNEYYNYSYDVRLDLIHQKLYELTEGEEDPELRGYNEFLLDSLDEICGYIQQLEKRSPKPEYTLDEINSLNEKYVKNVNGRSNYE